MEIFNIIFIPLLMVIVTVIYFVVGYKFLKKHRKKDGNNKTL